MAKKKQLVTGLDVGTTKICTVIAETEGREIRLLGIGRQPCLGLRKGTIVNLTETIESSKAEVIVDASPARLDRFLQLSIPVVRVRYQFQQTQGPLLEDLVTDFLRTK